MKTILIFFCLIISIFSKSQLTLDDRFERVGNTPIPISSLYQVKSLHFEDSLNGHIISTRALGKTVVFNTTDGGISWDSTILDMLYYSSFNQTKKPTFYGFQIDSSSGQTLVFLSEARKNTQNLWQTQKLLEVSFGYTNYVTVHRFSDNEAIISTSELYLNNNVLTGTYYTNNNFQTYNKISEDTIFHYFGDSSKIVYWNNHTISRILSNGSINSEPLYLHGAKKNSAQIAENEMYLIIHYIINDPIQYGQNQFDKYSTYILDKSTNLDKINIDQISSGLLELEENKIYFSEGKIVEMNIQNDSCKQWNYIEQNTMGDQTYVSNYYFTDFIEIDKCFVLSYVQGQDNFYNLFKSTNGQGGNNFSVNSIHHAKIYESTYEEFKIYPNPTNAIISIESPYNLGPCHFQIFNTGGEVIMSGIYNNPNFIIDLSDLLSGCYFIKVMDKNQVPHIKKIIKQ